MYVLDSCSFIVLGHYFPNRFPSFWTKFNKFVADGRVSSVKEVFKELDRDITKAHLKQWLKDNKDMFRAPMPAETEFVKEMFTRPEFQTLVRQKQLLTGGPLADPFVIALAKVVGGVVVTEEAKKDNAIRIPHVCDYYGIGCMNLEQLMEKEGWQF